MLIQFTARPWLMITSFNENNIDLLHLPGDKSS
jgi:hypothetical protein